MAGDSKVIPDVDKNTERKGSATPTPGLTSLDQQREASLADEGGSAGATVDGERAGVGSDEEDAEDKWGDEEPMFILELELNTESVPTPPSCI